MTTQTMTTDLCAPAGAKTDPATLRRAITASALGNATEWFDYGIYAYGVTYMSEAPFPADTDEAVLFTITTLAPSFLVRPPGGPIWGPLAHRLGRETVRALTHLLQ